jgi:hypothetical protein
MVPHRSLPDVKVEAGSTEISTDTITVQVHRILNGISFCKLSSDDYQGKNYIANLDKFTVLKVSFRYGSDSWEKVFEGKVEEVGPALSMGQGQTLVCTAYGYGRALTVTHSAVNFGEESENNTLDQPTLIWDDIVNNRVKKNFDGNATGWTLNDTKIKTLATPTINFVKGAYRNNLEILNQVCQIYLGAQAGSAGVHWWVDPSKNLWIDTIGAHSVDTGTYPTYWKITEAASTLVEGIDFLQTNFTANVRDFANKILLISDLRKPGYDYWTEDSGGAALWGNDGFTSITDSAAQFIVGSHSLLFDPNGAAAGWGYYPSGASADWDFSAIGSVKTIPHVNFYYRKFLLTTNVTWIVFSNNDTARKTDYYYSTFSDWYTDPDSKWIHVSLPIGPYYKTATENKRFRWQTAGNPPSDWSDIDTIEFYTSGGGANALLYVDDLHVSGKIIREAYNSTSIAANDEYQKIIKLDVAVDDTMEASDATGTAGYLAYAELLTRQTTPVTGQVTCPSLIVDIYPGQLVHIHGTKRPGGTFRVNSDFRVQQIIHTVSKGGASTTLDLTDDVKNTFATGHASSPTAQLSALKKALFVDPEAKSLKSGAVDELISRLSKDYP